MAIWVIETLDILGRKFHIKNGTKIGSFIAEAFKEMYQLPIPQYVDDKTYVVEFCNKHEDIEELIKEWRSDLNKLKKGKEVKYFIDSLASPFSQVVTILCGLYAYPNVSKFPEDWVPLIDGASDGYIFDGATMDKAMKVQELLTEKDENITS